MRHVAPRVVGLAGELDALAETEVGEHDPRRGDGREHAVPALGAEALGGEVAEPWNEVTRKATMTIVMIASFHQTRTLLIRANQRIPT